MTTIIRMGAADLCTGDHLLRLGDTSYPQRLNPDTDPVIVAAVRPPEQTTAPGEGLVEVVTSTGLVFTTPNTPAQATRPTEVTTQTILLISRRASLHAQICAWGRPIIRRTPLTVDETAFPVTLDEWVLAPLIVIDGFLAPSTLGSMWRRGDLAPRDQILLLCTDPDDPHADLRLHAARANAMAVLPYDRDTVVDCFKTATGDPTATGYHPGLFAAHRF